MPTPANSMRKMPLVSAGGSCSPNRPLDPGRVSCRLPLRTSSRPASRNERFQSLFSSESTNSSAFRPSLLRESSSESTQDLGRACGKSVRPASPASSIGPNDILVRPPIHTPPSSTSASPSRSLANSKTFSVLSPAPHPSPTLGQLLEVDRQHRDAISELAEKVLGTVLPTIAALREDFERSREAQRAGVNEVAAELRQEVQRLERATMPLCQRHDVDIVDLRQQMEGMERLHVSMMELSTEVSSLRRDAMKTPEGKSGYSDATVASGILANSVNQAVSEHSVLYRELAQSIEAERVDRCARIIEIHADVNRLVEDSRSALQTALDGERAERVGDSTELRAVLDSVWQELHRGRGGKRSSGSRMLLSSDADVNTVYEMASEALGETVRLSSDLLAERDDRQQALLKVWMQLKGLREELSVAALVKNAFDRHTSEK